MDCESEAIDPDFILVRDGITKIPADSFVVYLSPTENLISIEPGSDTGYVLVYCCAGQVVYEQSIPEAKSMQLNVSNYKTGIYIINFLNSAGESFSREVVVAR